MADVFIEQLVKKLPDSRSTLRRFAIVMGVALVPFFFLYAAPYVPFLDMFVLPVLVLCVWGGMVLWRRTGLEYEYIFTNGSLDVDVIYGRRSRKRLLTVDCTGFEILAPVSEQYAKQFTSQSIVKRIVASSHVSSPGRWFAVFNDKDGKRTLLIFEPGERIMDGFKTKIRSKISPPY
jgi:hypothetical protein